MIAGAAMQALPAIFGLFGNKMDKKRRDSQEGKASKGFSQLTDVFESQMNQDYFDSAEGMGAMREIDENSSDNFDQINAMSNVNGMTDEAKIAMMGQNMKAKQGAYAGLAQNSSLWRQRAMQNYQGSLGNLFSAGQQNRANTNRSIGNIVNGFQGAMDGAANAGVFDKMLGGGSAGKAMGAPGAGVNPGLRFQNSNPFG